MTTAPTTIDPKQANLATAYEVPGALYSIEYDREARRLYGAGSDGAIHVVDLFADEPKVAELATPHDNYVSSLVRVGDALVSGGYDRRIVWTDRTSSNRLRTLEAHDGWVRDLVVSPDGTRIASVGDDMLVKLWDAATGQLVRTFAGHADRTPEGYATALYAVAVSPDGRVLASGDRIGDVRLWDVETGEQIARIEAPTFYTFDAVKRARAIGGIRSLAFSPDGSELAISGIGRVTNVDGFVGPCRLEVWDWRAAKRTFVGQDSHKAVLNDVRFHPEGDWIVAGGGGDGGGILAFWDRSSEKPIAKHKPKGHLHRVRLDLENGQLVAAGFGGFQVWSLEGDDGDEN